MRVKSKTESYGALAHKLIETFKALQAVEGTIDGLREQFPEDVAALSQARADVVGAVVSAGMASRRVTDIVPKPSQPAGYEPISET